MRYKKVFETIKLLNTFIQRNVFNIGVLKNKVFRYAIMLGVAALIMLAAFLLFAFFDMNDSSISQTTIVIDIYSITTMMWTFVIFLFMKILFMKKDSFLMFTQQLPITKRERNVAVLLFELLISITIITIISSSLVFALIYKYKFIFIGRLICNIFLSSILYYLILECIYSLINSVLCFFKLGKVRNVCIYCMLTIVFVVMYKIVYPEIVDSLLFQYADGKTTSIVLIYSYIMENTNILLTLISFVAITAILSIVILSLKNDDFISTSKYFKLSNKQSTNISLLKAYLLNFTRGIDTYNYLIISIFIYCLLTFTKVQNAIYSVLILSINGIYFYIQTDKLRFITFQKNYSVVKDYIYLIVSQIIYISVVAGFMVIVSTVINGQFTPNLIIFFAIILSVIMFTLIGIIIPPKRENPFTVMIGFVVIFILLAVTVLICFISNFKMQYNIIILICVVMFSIYYSINGLMKLREESKYEK